MTRHWEKCAPLSDVSHVGPIHIQAICHNGNKIKTCSAYGILTIWDALFLAKVTEHLSICRGSIPSLRRNGGSLLWVESPSVFHPNSFLHSILHTCLTNIIYTISLMLLTKHVVHMGHFQNVQWSFTRTPFPRYENLPMKFGSCRPSHMVFLQCVPLAHSSSIQTTNHHLLIQSKFDCSITKQWH